MRETRVRSQGLYGKMGPLPPAALAVGLFPESQTFARFIRVVGVPGPRRVKLPEARARPLCGGFATVQRVGFSAAPRCTTFFKSLVTQLESPTLEGGSGDAPHSDGRRVLAVAATCRPVKQNYNS